MASKGTSKFVMQRMSAMVMLPLLLWFLISLVGQAGASHADMRSWLVEPLNAFFLVILILTGVLHMRIGLSEIIEDYIHSSLRTVLSVVNWGFALLIGGFTVINIITVAFGS